MAPAPPRAVSSSGPGDFGFTTLSASAFLAVPPEGGKPSQACISGEPHLVVLATWMGASWKHASKYATTYRALFPTARVLVVSTTAWDMAVRPAGQRLKELEPALEVVAAVQPQQTVLWHLFSNGGATTSWQLAQAHRERTGASLPVSRLVLDCSPGTLAYRSVMAAFAVGLPSNPLVAAPAHAILHVLWVLWLVWLCLTRDDDPVLKMRRGLNDAGLFPVRAMRLYIYSAADRLVYSDDVESHAEAARSSGFDVRTVKFQTSAHVAHPTVDFEKYWGSIKGLWDSDYLSSPGLIRTAF